MATTGNKRLDAMIIEALRTNIGGGADTCLTAIWEDVSGRMCPSR